MGLAGAPPSPAVASGASSAGAVVVAVPASSAGTGRRAASTDWRLETRAAGRGLRLGASSPELSAIGIAAVERDAASPGRGWGRERESEGRKEGSNGACDRDTRRGGNGLKWPGGLGRARIAYDFKDGPALRVGRDSRLLRFAEKLSTDSAMRSYQTLPSFDS
jgi:hypothetical protein